MSVKDFFNSGESTSIITPAKSLDDLGREVESPEYVAAHLEEKDQFRPHIDFSSASNFAKFGSAEQYYEDAITRIYKTYPYDGSLREKKEWHNSSSYIDKYIFDKEYPRTNGYANLSAEGWGTLQGSIEQDYGAPASADYEYIQVKGGPNRDSDNKTVAQSFPGLHKGKANFYELSTRRKSNLAIDGNNGVSVEFWLKKPAFTTTKTKKEVIFDLWNGELSSSADYGRLTIELTGATSGSPFLVTMQSGTATNGFFQQSIGSTPTTGTLTDWNHYAFTFANSGSTVQTKFYLNGALEQTTLSGSTVGEVTKGLIANIGALRTAPSGAAFIGTSVTGGYGKLSGSIDEFRYWTAKRTSKDIGRHWFAQVGGGTNTDAAFSGTLNNKYNQDFPVDLGVYYKFNEGTTTDTGLDARVLDYSGRISNGSWVGYVGDSSRATGSAMVLASAAETEYEDPIIYSSHPEVDSLLTAYKLSGSTHDRENNALIYHSIPAWISEEDDESGKVLRKMTQTLASYFDTLHLQIESLPGLKNVKYISSSFKSLPFEDRLLDDQGFVTPDILTRATILENLASRDEDREFKQKLYETKQQIYKNIYNNLVYIYKSKGTEKAFRNLIRCFGVDDELIKLNLYADNVTHEIRDNYRSTAYRKKFVSFNDPNHFSATVYQTASTDVSDSLSYISGSDTGLVDTSAEFFIPWTIETEVIFPKKVQAGTDGYFTTSFLSSSLFGSHEATASSADYTWASDDNNNFQVYAVRDELESDNVYFVLTSSLNGWPTLTSSLYYDIYDNQKWNFAVRMYIDKTNNGGSVKGAPVNDIVADSAADVTGYIELYGVNSVLDQVVNDFHVSGALDFSYAIDPDPTVNKRIYAGAHRTNFTGAVDQYSDVKISSVRYWNSYLSNDVIKAHARDPANFGTEHPYRNIGLFKTSLLDQHVPSMETLALHWDFDNVTGSDASGEFFVKDYSSGSSDTVSRYGWFGNIIGNRHPGKAEGFQASSTTVVSNEFLHSAKQRLPDSIASDSMVNVLNRDDEIFTRESRPIKYFYAVEKSMYQTISEEMINFFATVADFDNLIGDPVNRYRQGYKEMGKIRQLFYERIRNTPSLEKYISFYKWIDSEISEMILQLIPASANMSEKMRNVVESHVLERNKYWSKFPTIEMKPREPEAGLRGVTELVYDWKHGHAPLSNVETDNCLWWSERTKGTNAVITSGDSTIDEQRDIINAADKHRAGSVPNLSSDTSTGYYGSAYALNRFSKHLKMSIGETRQIHGGINFHKNKKMNYLNTATEPFGELRIVESSPGSGLYITASVNYLLVTGSQVYSFEDCNDTLVPNQKRRQAFNVKNSREYGLANGYDFGKGHLLLPFNVHSSSVTTGYAKEISDSTLRTKIGNMIDLTNMHSDAYGEDKEVPMQGPFTEKFVGGRQHRHVAINKYDSSLSTTSKLQDQYTRSEAWYVFFGSDGAGASFGIVGPTYTTTGEYDKDVPRATRMRSEFAKRPVNIRNIQQTTGSGIGNYESNWNLVNTVGRTQNNAYFKDNGGTPLPDRLTIGNYGLDNLPTTTNVHTMVAVTTNAGSTGTTSLGGVYFGQKAIATTLTPSIRFLDDETQSPRGSSATEYTLPRRDLTGSNSVIVSRFSAPGGPEINSRGFLDIMAEEYSVHNALPFRNLSVRSSGSGEDGTIRMSIEGHTIDTAARDREGLRTRLTRHCGQLGYDSQHGSPFASFHKVNRNPIKRIKET